MSWQRLDNVIGWLRSRGLTHAHAHPARRQRLPVRLRAGLLPVAAPAVLLCALVGAAPAHEAVTGWTYPTYCCGGDDCGHALAAHRNADGSLTVTTEHGTATFPASFKHDPSPDGLIHACFTPLKLYCLFLSIGM